MLLSKQTRNQKNKPKSAETAKHTIDSTVSVMYGEKNSTVKHRDLSINRPRYYGALVITPTRGEQSPWSSPYPSLTSPKPRKEQNKNEMKPRLLFCCRWMDLPGKTVARTKLPQRAKSENSGEFGPARPFLGYCAMPVWVFAPKQPNDGM